MELGKKILSDITVFTKYAKYLPEEYRRESWNELVTRNKNMHIEKFPFLEQEINEAYELVYQKKVLPSMRGLQFSGKAIKVNPARNFNCCYGPIDDLRMFSETMFLLLSGCGVGYSVQFHDVDKLPAINKPKGRNRRYLIADSIEGWADSIKVLIQSYFEGSSKIILDYSDIRPKGSPLKTSGGRAPGSEPLKICHAQIEAILNNKQDGEKLKPIDCHDIVCHLADAVLSGGVRRSSCISLFSADDEEMLSCKFGNWYETNPQRARANNSPVLLRHRISKQFFDNLWKKIEYSNTGEPGLFFSNDQNWGCNPCCISGMTEVRTNFGLKLVKDLVEKEFKIIVNNKEYNVLSNGFWKTGEKDVFWVQTKYNQIKENYLSVKVTKDHKFLKEDKQWVALENLKIGDKIWVSNNCSNLEQFDNSLLEEIEEITYVGKEEVYDISVDEVHEFEGNGIRLHNCEIGLRPFQMCNLTEINVSDVESQEDYNNRARKASFIATLQASYTDFHYLRPIWKRTTDKEALIGVGMTGIASGKVLNFDLTEAANIVKEENERVAALIGINKAARATTVKPSGTTSCVLGTSSGIHAWHAKYYLRRMRVNKMESIYKFLLDNHPELIEDDFFSPHDKAVITLPIKAPMGSITREDETALDLLERVKKVHNEWVKVGHRSGANYNNVSVTVSIPKDNWQEVGEWIWNNRNDFTGISCLPMDYGTYVQTPFEDITEEKYNELIKNLKDVDLQMLVEYSDQTEQKSEVACAGGACLV